MQVQRAGASRAEAGLEFVRPRPEIEQRHVQLARDGDRGQRIGDVGRGHQHPFAAAVRAGNHEWFFGSH